jgi:hypothetical protein
MYSEPTVVGKATYLTASAWTCTNTNGRYVQSIGDVRSKLMWDSFEDDRKRACTLDGQGSMQDTLGRRPVLSLDFVSRQGGVTLRKQPDMTHDGYAHGGEPAHTFNDLGTAFQFYAFYVSILDEFYGVANGVLRGCLI